MNRLIPVLAVASAVLLMVGAGLGLASVVEGREGPGGGRSSHGWVGLAGASGALLVLVVGTLHLRCAWRRVVATVQDRRLPGWLSGQAERAARRGDPFRVGAGALLLVAGILGMVAEGSWLGRLWHVVLGATSLSFTMGALAVEAVSLAALARVAREVAAFAGRQDTDEGLTRP